MKYDVFISYSRKDFDEVSALIETIRAEIPALSMWFDITGIESGDEFEEKIISAIDNSSYVLFALSDNALESQWTKDEVIYAKNTGKKIIPILLKGASLKGWFLFKFGRVDCIDFSNPLQKEKLLKNLSDWTGKTRSKKSEQSPVKATLSPLLSELPSRSPSVRAAVASFSRTAMARILPFQELQGRFLLLLCRRKPRLIELYTTRA